MKPLISVLVPMFNVEKFVKHCLSSILNQTYRNLEIILVDDSSQDNTFAIAKNIAQMDERIKLFRKQNEKNISLTRNFLLDKISGEFFVFVDSDDCVKPDFIEKLYLTHTLTHADLVSCGYHIQKRFRMKKSKKSLGYSLVTSNFIGEVLFGKTIKKAVWNKLFKTSLLGEIKFNKSVRFGEDVLFVIDYLKNCKLVAHVNEKLYYYTIRKGSEMHSNFGEKHLSFVNGLVCCVNKEKRPQERQLLLSWLCLTCVWFTFLARKSGEVEVDWLKELAFKTKKYTKFKAFPFAFKLLIFFGIHSWCRKDKVFQKLT